MRKLLNFIYSKKVDGIYSITTIFGIKITTTPIKLQLQNIYKNIDDINKNFHNAIYSVNKHINVINEIILANYLKNHKTIYKNYNDFINNLFNSKKIVSACFTIDFNDVFSHLNLLFKKSKLQIVFDPTICYGDIYAFWGFRAMESNITILKNALYSGKKNIVYFELGFLNRVSLCKGKYNYSSSISFIFDDLFLYYSCIYENRLEQLLQDTNLIINKEQIDRSKKLINYIIENKITKYNHQPIYKPNIGTYNKKKILVVDQSYGDMSIVYGNANEETFKNMLKKAIDDNPNCDILIKTHPDSIAQNTTRPLCYFSKDDIKENVYLLQEEINPISLLEIVDKVYVVSSQLGFEALMMGKEVHVFGIPFYSNYGLTIDYQKCERRTGKRTLEEMFYIVYIMYSYYVDPLKEQQCEIEDAIDYLIKLRKEYFLEFNIRCDDKNLLK